jgi:hypothetical protein
MGLLCFFHRNQTKQHGKNGFGFIVYGLLCMGLLCLVSGKNTGV